MSAYPNLLLSSAIALIAVWAAGCTTEPGVPASAKLVRNGEGEISYVADDDGMVYVKDQMSGTVIASLRVLRDRHISIAVTANEIKVDRVVVPHKLALDPEHSYEVYFDRAQ